MMTDGDLRGAWPANGPDKSLQNRLRACGRRRRRRGHNRLTPYDGDMYCPVHILQSARQSQEHAISSRGLDDPHHHPQTHDIGGNGGDLRLVLPAVLSTHNDTVLIKGIASTG
jgi:hypothetical protein